MIDLTGKNSEGKSSYYGKVKNITNLFKKDQISDSQMVPSDIMEKILDPRTSNISLCGIAITFQQEEVSTVAVSSLLHRNADCAELAVAFTSIDDCPNNRKLKSKILSKIIDSNPDSEIMTYLKMNCKDPELKLDIRFHWAKIQREKKVTFNQREPVLLW